MADANSFIDAVGADVSKLCVPPLGEFLGKLGADVAVAAGPKASAFAGQLVKEIVEANAPSIQAFAASLIKDLFSRYHPSLSGNLHMRIVENGIEISSTDTRLELQERASGGLIAVLDLPIFMKINLNEMFVRINSVKVSLRDVQL